MEFVSSGNKRTYEEFSRTIPPSVKPLFESIREFCLSLGDNVVEDIRMHRIVFGKSMTFRWFTDVEPEKESIIVKIQKTRKESPTIVQLNSESDFEQVKEDIKNAYVTIN